MSIYPKRSELIPAGLPPYKEVLAEGKKLTNTTVIGKSLFLKEHGVSSEVEFKQRMVAQGKIMFHGVYGLDNIAEHVEGSKRVYEELCKRGARLDRWTIVLARPMGLPPDMRRKVPKETGLMLDTPEDWIKIGNVVPIQPHLGDSMVGSPASVENLLCALAAGVTTIGNVGQFFSFDYPGWRDTAVRTVNFVKALGMMAQLKDKGIVVGSNLDDGSTSLLNDRANYIGWAMLERYIVEDLIGADLKHYYGNVVTDPRTRLAIIRAIDEIHGGETAGAFVNGNTVYTPDSEKNIAILSNCLLFDIVGQLKKPTGHAVHAVPLTEHERIPSPAEVAQVAVIANQMEEEAHKVVDLIDFEEIDRIKDKLIEGGRVFLDKSLKGLADIGIDTKDPLELLLALKRIGTRRMEELFGVGKEDGSIPGGRRPLVPSEMFHHTLEIAGQMKKDIGKRGVRAEGKKVLLLTTDVHEFAKLVIGIALQTAGVEIIDLGHSVDPEQIVDALAQDKVDGVCISTHNGMALSYARKLIDEMNERQLKVPVFMGGRLNELTGEDILPRDVTADLKALKITACKDVFDVLEKI